MNIPHAGLFRGSCAEQRPRPDPTKWRLLAQDLGQGPSGIKTFDILEEGAWAGGDPPGLESAPGSATTQLCG